MVALLPLCVLFSFTSRALANTEKTIFIAPRQPVPASTDLASLCLPVLSPAQSILRTRLQVTAVGKEAAQDRRTASWYILNHLTSGQRYEARVCWVATVRLSLSPTT